ncbi:MAG: hypothetical protein EU529_01300 [Promethearchaeota archaeon]|nr:MAG: hypothetical protein EU529_01300 [Candidatus Lokiarchaeota archaeon]
MLPKKKEIKRLSLIGIFIFLILISNLPTINQFESNSDKRDITIPIDLEDFKNPHSSGNINLTDFITGKGVNRTVRTYMNNKSSSLNNNGYFNITAPVPNANLSSGEFYFNFDNNFTTDYPIESDSALNPSGGSYFEEYNYDSDSSSIEIHNGTGYLTGNFDDLTDASYLTYWNISSSKGFVNFTICANFSGVNGNSVDFDRKNIIGFILNSIYNISLDANLTVYMKDFYDTGDFINITNTIEINSTLGPHNIDELRINRNLIHINSTNCTLLRFIFDRSDNSEFNVTLYEFNIKSFLVLELEITNTTYIALEFDLLGLKSTVNGFYAWIRTLNLTKARNARLNISLYRANNTMDRSLNNLIQSTGVGATIIQPNLTQRPLDSKLWEYSDYHGDELFYFDFDSSKTNNLTRYNYFIVIKSNSSEPDIYSLVTLPVNVPFGDGEYDHVLKKTTDNGVTWKRTTSFLSTAAKDAGDLEASQFILNVTRGYIPSDFKIEGKQTLKIQDENIDELTIIFDDSPILKWGLGNWAHDFNPSIGIYADNKFRVNLTWNKTYIKGFKFNVNYTVEAFFEENITSFYHVNYLRTPEWIFNYSLNLFDSKFDNWNFTQFWYIYPDYFDAQNLAVPNVTQTYNKTGREFSFDELPNYERFVVDTSIINASDKAKYTGTYALNLTSPNAIINDAFMHSYINFEGNLWETRGFMYGDNISVSVDIQDHNGLAPLNGKANVTLFYPNGTQFPGANLYSQTGDSSSDKTIRTYRFDNKTILELTKDVPLVTELSTNEHYSLGFFWSNGSIIGCKKIPIYLFVYDINLSRCVFIPEDNINNLQGRVFNNFLKNYSLLIASINETTGNYNPNFYPINKDFTKTDGLFYITYKKRDLQVHMKNFRQNETILNPEEKVKIKVEIQNLDLLFDLDVKISVKLVSLANEKWIIAQNSSKSKNLKLYGDQNEDDIQEFEVDLTIPEFNETELIWEGINAPVRQGGAKTIVTIYIENNKAGTYICNNYSLLINETDNIFEGYILALKHSKGLSATTILEKFRRDVCVYLPNQTVFMANIYDPNYVSFFNQYIEEFELKMNSKFINIIVDPQNPIEGEEFDLSSVLTTEFGSPLPNKKVLCQYYKNNKWVNFSDSNPILTTDLNGSTSFSIDTLKYDFEETLVIRLSWKGDDYRLNNSINITIGIIKPLNKISISSKDDESIVYRNTDTAITFSLKNTGNSILKIIDITINIEDKDLDYKIRGQDNNLLNWFSPEDSIEIIVVIEVSDTDYNELDIQITIFAENILSNEPYFKQDTITVEVIDKGLGDYILEYFLVIMVILFVLIGLLTFIYAKRTKKKIEKLPEEPLKKKPRRGRYVKVSELEPKKVEERPVEGEKAEPAEIITEEKIEPKKAKETKTTDLDTLLAEEIEKKEEKSLKKARKLPKRVKKPSKKPKKVITEPTSLKKVKKKKKVEKKPKKSIKKKIKSPKKVESKKIKKKKTTDFDELLKEKGLDD